MVSLQRRDEARRHTRMTSTTGSGPFPPQPGVKLRANLNSIFHRCYLMAFVWELTKETMHLPQDYLQGGSEENYFGAIRDREIPWEGHLAHKKHPPPRTLK